MHECYILFDSTLLTNLQATESFYPLACLTVQSLMLMVKYCFKTNHQKNKKQKPKNKKPLNAVFIACFILK